eukprot:scaffold44868_cov59-Attheya_sp.AAC.9
MTNAPNSGGDELLSRLVNQAGVNPSPEWWQACCAHVQGEPPRNNGTTGDSILHEILHSDLRDVVRPRERDTTTTWSINSDEPHQILRQAIVTSSNLEASGKAILPPGFKCMVQLEELLDVSVNAETRLSVGPASATSAPTPVGNQRTRCLKMVLSDGYPVDTTCSTDHTRPNNSLPMVAMEISPIPNLSVQSKPGIKVLLSGSIVVRLGVIMLHEGNAMVLGGQVPALIEVQHKALDLARRNAAVGVDPTIKALIWNPLTGSEQEDDEGEAASSDIVPQPANIVAPGQAPQAPPVDGPIEMHLEDIPTHGQTTGARSAMPPQTNRPRHMPPQRLNPPAPAPVAVSQPRALPAPPSRNTYTTASGNVVPNNYARAPVATGASEEHSRRESNTPQLPIPTRHTPPSASSRHGSHGNSSADTSSLSTMNAPPPGPQIPIVSSRPSVPRTAPKVNPYASLQTAVPKSNLNTPKPMLSSTSTSTGTKTSPIVIALDQTSPDHSNTTASGGNIGTTKTTPTSTSSSRSPATSAQRAQHSTASSQESGTSDANNSGTAAQAISFKEFRSLVEKACNDIVFYKEQMGR